MRLGQNTGKKFQKITVLTCMYLVVIHNNYRTTDEYPPKYIAHSGNRT